MSFDPESRDEREQLVDQICKDIAEDMMKRLKTKLKRLDKVVSGTAEGSIEYDEEQKIVGSTLDYMYNIEFGREAGSHVPLEPLKDWCVQKLHIPESKAWGAAKQIEKHIYENGIPMTRFWKMVLGEMENDSQL